MTEVDDYIQLQRRDLRCHQAARDHLRHPAPNISQQAYYLYDASQKVVSAWEPYVKNWSPNNGLTMAGADGGLARSLIARTWLIPTQCNQETCVVAPSRLIGRTGGGAASFGKRAALIHFLSTFLRPNGSK